MAPRIGAGHNAASGLDCAARAEPLPPSAPDIRLALAPPVASTRPTDTDMGPRLSIPRDKVAAFCRKHGIRKLSLFGSVIRDDFGPDSDVDVLAEFKPGARLHVD